MHRPERPGPGRSSRSRAAISLYRGKRTCQSLLDLAEACDVPVRWSCRTGVCHSCESGLVAGAVRYDPDPLEPLALGNLLLCCSKPQGDVVLDI
ncbi:MAG: 2Fe-2S iron-sulfur cluster-binding protein [Vulcanimicrobiaceae bacterium]